MRDIRKDLRERLESVRTKREVMQRSLSNLTAQEDVLTKLLAEEDAMWERVNPPLFENVEEKPVGSPLSQVLLDTLKGKSAPATLSELKEAAVQRGVPFGGKRPGRVIHFAMLGMAQHKLVERMEDGKWMLVEHPVN